MKYIGIIVIILTTIMGCNVCKKQSIQDTLKKMQYAKVDLCIDDLLLKKSFQTTNPLDFNMIVYVDSSECTPCELGHLRFWNPLIKESLEKSTYKTGLTIILAPNLNYS